MTYTWKSYDATTGDLLCIYEQSAKSRNAPKRTIRFTAREHAKAGIFMRFSRIKTIKK